MNPVYQEEEIRDALDRMGWNTDNSTHWATDRGTTQYSICHVQEGWSPIGSIGRQFMFFPPRDKIPQNSHEAMAWCIRHFLSHKYN